MIDTSLQKTQKILFPENINKADDIVDTVFLHVGMKLLKDLIITKS